MGTVAWCRIGQRPKGLEWAERALAADPEDAGVRYNVACLYALKGESDEAIECLETAVQAGVAHKEWVDNDPDLDSLRDDPRFEALTRECRQTPSAALIQVEERLGGSHH